MTLKTEKSNYYGAATDGISKKEEIGKKTVKKAINT